MGRHVWRTSGVSRTLTGGLTSTVGLIGWRAKPALDELGRESVTAENPYQSPTAKAVANASGAARSAYGPHVMLLWGLVAGSMLGGTFGAVGGAVIGLGYFVAFLIATLGQFALAQFAALGPPEIWLVQLLAGGTIAGAIGGMFTGGLLGPVLALLGWATGWQNPTRFIVAASVLSALGAAATVFLVGRMLAQRPWSEALLESLFAAVIAAAAGAIGGRRLGRLLLDIMWPRRLNRTNRAEYSSFPIFRRH